jgi:putative membrane protein
MTASRLAGASLAVLTASALALAGCEKPADMSASGTPLPPPDTSAPAAASTLPDLPIMSVPSFGPDFVANIGSIDLLEVAEGKLALQKSTDERVRDFAELMIQSHGQSTTALTTAVKESGERIDMPERLTDTQQTKMLLLGRNSGPAFDKAYIIDQVDIQQQALKSLRAYAENGDSAALKKFAGGRTASVESHMAAAAALQAQLK